MRRACVGLLGIALFVATPALATTMLTLDVGQLTRYSNSIVIGDVTAVEVIADQPGVPLTRLTVDVSEALKGALEGSVEVLSPGFPGAPEFVSGEQLVLFIHSEDGVNVLTGFQQGRFGVNADGTLDRAIPGAGGRSAGNTLEALVQAVQAAE